MRVSLEAKLTALVAGLIALGVAIAIAIGASLGEWQVALPIALGTALAAGVAGVRRFMRPVNATLQVLSDGVASFRDRDYSVSIAVRRRDELGQLVQLYNEVGEALRSERQNLYQRELLLDTVIQATPLALVLVDPGGRVGYTNAAARRLFASGRRFEGRTFAQVLEEAPPALRAAAESAQDGLFTVDVEGEAVVLHVAREAFTLNTRRHQLYLFRELTRELSRQEAAIWKKVIRVLSHELNNSLAPISSLAHTGGELLRQGDTARLPQVFGVIEERAAHLRGFLEGYARFARLPAPRLESVALRPFVESLRGVLAFEPGAAVPEASATFDRGQVQQVLINLLKNAHESGSPGDAVHLQVAQDAGGVQFRVLDRGGGMADEVLRSALLPFYSTKAAGGGLGLALSREIVEAHGGRLALANREGGGFEVRVWLPAPAAA